MKKNRIETSFMRGVQRLVATTLIAGATVLSGQTAVDPETSADTLRSSMPALKGGMLTTVVDVMPAGALYVLRSDDWYYFWVLDTALDQLKLVDLTMVDIHAPHLLKVNLNPDISGVFYADNLVDDDGHVRIDFQGELTDGRIAIPMNVDYFSPLELYANAPGAVVNIGPGTPELLDIKNTQAQIYAAVDTAMLDVQVHSDDFIAQMQSHLVAGHNQAQADGVFGEALMAQAESDTQLQLDTLLQWLDADVVATENAVNAAAAEVNQTLANVDVSVNECMLNLLKTFSGLGDKLMNSAEASFDETEQDNQAFESMVVGVERQLGRGDEMFTACVAGLEVLADYQPPQTVDETAYENSAAQIDAMQNQNEADVSAWQSVLENTWQAFADGIDSDAMLDAVSTSMHHFDPWISDKFLLDDGTYPDRPGYFSKHLSGANTKQSRIGDDLKGAEVLCENETFNIKFNLGVVQVVIGTWWDDQIVGSDQHSLILALPGDDCVEAHDGIDVVVGMAGDDVLYGGDHHDLILAGRGEDEVHGGAGKHYSFTISGIDFEVAIGNLIFGGAGNDTVFGGEMAADMGDDGTVDPDGFADLILGDGFWLAAAAGDDLLIGEGGIDIIIGQDGNDTLTNTDNGVITVASVPLPFGSFFWGNDGNDTVVGSNTPNLIGVLGDFIFTNDGLDTVFAGSGRDFIFTGFGDDTGDGGSGNDFVFTRGGDDNFNGGAGVDLIFGGDGADILNGGPGIFDLIIGSNGNDNLSGGPGMDFIIAGTGDDNGFGNDGPDLIVGGGGNDRLFGNASFDVLIGNRGNDLLHGNDGPDLLIGGHQSDNLFGDDGPDLLIGNDNDEDLVETLFGGAGVDLIIGGAGNDQIQGQDGLDLVIAGPGDDVVSGGNGTDLLIGSDGVDQIDGDAGLDVIIGSAGNDLLSGGDGSDLIIGGAGADLINGQNNGDLIFGGADNDVISGDAGLDLLSGGNGCDNLMGGGETDLLLGGANSDRLVGDAQLNILLGGDGDDHVFGGPVTDVVLGNSGADNLHGNGGGDLVLGGSGADRVNGGDGNDLLLGGSDNDRLNAGNGTDLLLANSGQDRLLMHLGRNFGFGGSGNDVLDAYLSGADDRDFEFGNGGNDTLTGNQTNQRDIRIGGAGSDNKQWNTTLVTAGEFVVPAWTPVPCN